MTFPILQLADAFLIASSLVHEHRFMGFAYHGVVSLAAVALISMMLLALYLVLRRDHESSMAVAAPRAVPHTKRE